MIWRNSFFVIFLVLIAILNASAQQLNVDKISDAQLLKFVKQAEQRGLSESEIEIAAKARGISPTEITKLKSRINNLQSASSGTKGVSQLKRLRNTPENVNAESNLFAIIGQGNQKLPASERIYGMDIFQSSNLTFQPSGNIPTPKNYQLGAGDQIIIDIWGNSEKTYQVPISPEGNVRIGGVGPVYVSGLTIESASKKIRQKLKTTIYDGLGIDTYADISLGQLKSIKVNVIGEVRRQGTYVLSPFASVFNALYTAGGPTRKGSLRKIEHFRDGKKINTLDVYDFLFNGRNLKMSLNDQDLIIVRPYDTRVQIVGKVKSQGYYEVLQGESLADIIAFAGGFTSDAYTSKVTINRINQLNRTIETVETSDFSNLMLRSGDRISVSKAIDRYENRVRIAGAVVKPGEYEFEEGYTLTSLIKSAEGLKEDAFYGRGSILRLKPDLTLTLISFDLKQVLQGNDILLQNEDFVEIKSIFDLRDNYKVSIQGLVSKPGSYSYVDSMTVEDLILSAGGFRQEAARSQVEVARVKKFNDSSDPESISKIFNFSISEDLALSPAASSFLLEPSDLVIIRRSPNYESQQIVTVQGEVIFPGNYALTKKAERISDLLNRSGGPTNYAYVEGATLIRKTEYSSGDTSAKIRGQSIKELAQRDSQIDQIDARLKKRESIGINLEKIIKIPKSKYDLILKPGDILSVPKQLGTVRMRGELLFPNTIRYDERLRFKGYVSQAGGFSEKAQKGKSYVISANGSIQRTKRFFGIKFYPKIEPGAEVIIPEKREKRKANAGEIINLSTGVATFGLIVLRLIDLIGSDSN